MMSRQCVILLSDKSSGSSALQRELATHTAVNIARWTRHKENETLYWMKAVAALGMSQPQMVDSAYIPIDSDQARRELVEFLSHNVSRFDPPEETLDLVMAGWAALCKEYSPTFLEKSPHHLHSAAALSLMRDAAACESHTTFKYIGLVRNPTDTLYSMWTRWRVVPEEREKEWVRAYSNLLEFADSESASSLIVRYEDLVTEKSTIERVWRHIELESPESAALHAKSLSRWRSDPMFGYRPSVDVVQLAERFGYTEEQITPTGSRRVWAIERVRRVSTKRVRLVVGRLRRRIIAG